MITCPVCGNTKSRVTDSRDRHETWWRWRRRVCPAGHVYTTREVVELHELPTQESHKVTRGKRIAKAIQELAAHMTAVLDGPEDAGKETKP